MNDYWKIIMVACIGLFSWQDVALCWDKFIDPADYPGMPKNITEELRKKSCKIPQSNKLPQPNNVIHGEFSKKGQIDLAVMCYVESVKNKRGSTIPIERAYVMIFWDKKSHCGENGQILEQTMTGDSSKKEAFIQLANSKYLNKYLKNADHSGLEFRDNETNPIVSYCDNNGWGEVPDRE